MIDTAQQIIVSNVTRDRHAQARRRTDQRRINPAGKIRQRHRFLGYHLKCSEFSHKHFLLHKKYRHNISHLSDLCQFRQCPFSAFSGIFTDFSIYAVISTGLATASSLLFFSFDETTSLVGLTPAPLSVSSLVFAAIAGAEVSQKSRLVDNGDYIKEGIAFIAAPSCSFVLAYLLFNITGGESADSMTDFIVMAAALLILTALMFGSGMIFKLIPKHMLTSKG